MPWFYVSELDGLKRLGEQHTQALARVEATLCGLQRRLNVVQERFESNDASCKERIAKVEAAHALKVTSCTEVKEGLDAVNGHVAEIAAGLESLADCFVEIEGLLHEAERGKPRGRVHLPHLEKAKSKLQPGSDVPDGPAKCRGMWEQAGLAVTFLEKTKAHRGSSLREPMRTNTVLAVHPGDDGLADTSKGTPSRVGTPGGSPSSSTRNPDSDRCMDSPPQESKQTWADMSAGSASKIEVHVPSNIAESLRPPEPSSAESGAEPKASTSSRSSSRTLSPSAMMEEFTFSPKPSRDLATFSGKTSEPKQEDSQSEPPGSYVIWVPSCDAGRTSNFLQASCHPHVHSESPYVSVRSESSKGSGVARATPQRGSSTPASLAETAQLLTRREASPSVTRTEASREHPRQETWRKVRPLKQGSITQLRRNSVNVSSGVATVPSSGNWGAYTLQPQQPRQEAISSCTRVYGHQQRRLVCQRQEDAAFGANRKSSSKAPTLRVRSMPPLGTVSRNGRLVVR